MLPTVLISKSKLTTSSLRTYDVDYSNPSPQLIEENESLNYKLYYQYGLKDKQAEIEYDEFNDTIWYGKDGEEMVAKMLNDSQYAKQSDIFTMRDYHNNNIIGINGLKRATANLSTILHV